MTDLYAIYENGMGERRYQPRLDSGERLYVFWGWVEDDDDLFLMFSPTRVLARSSRRAKRIARREMRRRERARRNEFEEVVR